MRIISLLARHGTARYGDAVEALDAWFAQRLPGCSRTLVIADNALPPEHELTRGPDRMLVGASNASWEFSAWDRAVSWLGPRLDDCDLVHLATSAFRRYEPHCLDLIDRSVLDLL